MSPNLASADVEHLILHVEDEIAAAFAATDSTAPSLVLARLPQGGHYASIKRYTLPYGEGAVTLCAGKGTDLRGTLASLIDRWDAHILNPKSPAAIKAAPGVGEQACDRHDLVAALEASIALATQTKDPDTLRTVRKAVQAAGVRPVERERLLALLGAA